MKNAIALVLIATAAAAQASLTDNFDTLNPAWVTDRYEPAGFQTTTFGGRSVLEVTVDPSGSATNRPVGQQDGFYAYQGRQIAVSGIGGDYSASIDLYVSADMLTAPGNIDTGFWLRDLSPSEATSHYPTIGFENWNNGSPAFYAWDSDSGFQYSALTVTEGWYTLGIRGVGSTTTYSINGVDFYSDLTGSAFGGVKTAFINTWNDNSSTTIARYDSLEVVPEPASMAALGLGLAALRRRRRR